MSFIRSGQCNRCGECCGYPRATDGGQNNAWPPSWPHDLNKWQYADRVRHFPIFKLANPDKPFGSVRVGDSLLFWIWKDGLSKHLPPYNGTNIDRRCPFLSDKQADGYVPCLLYGTQFHYVWQEYCSAVPPRTYQTKKQVDNWFENCPSCSFVYSEED